MNTWTGTVPKLAFLIRTPVLPWQLLREMLGRGAEMALRFRGE
jgi:hypothetical protein